MFNVSAKEGSTGVERSLIITNDGNRLTKEEVDRMVTDAEQYRLNEHQKHRERTLTKNALETLLYSTSTLISKFDAQMSPSSADSLTSNLVNKVENYEVNEVIIIYPPNGKKEESQTVPQLLQNPKGEKRARK